MSQNWLFVSAGTIGTGNGTTVTPGLPAGYIPGDVFVLFATATIAYGASVTGYVGTNYGAATPFSWAGMKQAGYAETAPAISNTDTAAQAVLLCYRNVYFKPGQGVDHSSSLSTGTTTVGSGSIGPTFADELIIHLFASTASAGSWTNPANTNQRVSSGGTASITGILIDDEDWPTNNGTATRTATYSASVALSGLTLAFVQVPAYASLSSLEAPGKKPGVREFYLPPWPYSGVVAAPPPPVIQPILVPPQGVDLTLEAMIQSALVSGQTPPVIKITENANVPQWVDLTLPAQIQEALFRGQTPPVLGLLSFSPQQSYVDVGAQVWKPRPANQGQVPPQILVPQQSYVDVPPRARGPTPMPQGPVPPQWINPPQPDTSQLGTFVIPAATFHFAVGPVPPIVWAAPNWDLTQQGVFSAPLIGSTPKLIPIVQGSPSWDLTQQGQVFSPQQALLTGPVPPPVSAPPQADISQLGTLVWSPTVAPPVTTGPVIATIISINAGQDPITVQYSSIFPSAQAGGIPPPPAVPSQAGGTGISGDRRRKLRYSKEIFREELEKIEAQLREATEQRIEVEAKLAEIPEEPSKVSPEILRYIVNFERALKRAQEKERKEQSIEVPVYFRLPQKSPGVRKIEAYQRLKMLSELARHREQVAQERLKKVKERIDLDAATYFMNFIMWED